MKKAGRISPHRDAGEASGQDQFFRDRRALLFLGAAGFLNLLAPFRRSCFASVPEDCYTALAGLTKLEPLDKPLFIFRDYEDDPDQEIQSHILKGVRKNPGLLQTLRNRLGLGRQVSVRIEHLEIRLLFVPEFRKKYAEVYEQYCAHAIEFVLDKTKFDNPYIGVVNPVQEYPEVPLEGITAFTVHQLGKQYRAKCIFSGEEGGSVKFKIEGAVFSNHLGSVVLHIQCPREGVFLLRRRNYSIWQNRSQNLYTLLSIPVEETFHFVMGQYTDRKIEEDLTSSPAWKVFEVQNLANHWMAVEEALVGGLVHTVLRSFLNRNSMCVSSSEIDRAIEAKTRLPQYRFLKTGIALVDKLGYEQAISMFKSDPGAFGRLLAQGSTGVRL